MNIFVKPQDELSTLINDKANFLYQQLLSLPVEQLALPEYARTYYQARHIQRMYFSVQTAAVMLYDAIVLSKKHWTEVVIMEYGAGMGSLYLLTSLIGCKTTIYEDISQEMTDGAKIVAKHLNIPIDHFITGDHRTCLHYLKQHNVICDIIISRNVVEHIYDLNDFYGCMMQDQPNAILYFSTTANIYNPMMYLYHINHHRDYEKHKSKPDRIKYIQERCNSLSQENLDKLVSATRGLAIHDLDVAIAAFENNGVLPNPSKFKTNTCDPYSGIWYENLINKSDYKQIIESKGYKMYYQGAFWDTHYSNTLKNMVTKGLNIITKSLGKKHGIYVAPFVYIIAVPKQLEN